MAMARDAAIAQAQRLLEDWRAAEQDLAVLRVKIAAAEQRRDEALRLLRLTSEMTLKAALARISRDGAR
jgi:hypothetical protein